MAHLPVHEARHSWCSPRSSFAHDGGEPRAEASVGLPCGHTVWDRCGVLFVNTDDSGNITSINVKHSMFPDVEMVAFPRRDEDPVTE